MHTNMIIGAGPAGLAAARAFLSRGLSPLVLEAHTGPGGIWDQGNDGSPMYDSAHFISSRDLSGFPGFPMPRSFPDYPGHRLLLDYLNAFATAYGIDEHTRYGTRVLAARPDEKGWTVTTTDGEEIRASSLTVASGTTWTPSLPAWASRFAGEFMHSSDYRTPIALAGGRVLVVGAGNSGVDIACDLSRLARVSLSVRRGYHIVPKHLMGLPADVIASRSRWMPTTVAQRTFARLVRAVVGRPERHGWPEPDHRLFESHPIVSDQLMHLLRHGDLDIRPDVASVEGREVRFRDGTAEEFDVIIAATGYDYAIPYLPADLLEWRQGRPQLWMQTFAANLPTFAAVGLGEFNGGAWPVFDQQARLVADVLVRRLTEPEALAGFDAQMVRRVDLRGGVSHVASARHAAYVHKETFAREVDRLRRRLSMPDLPIDDRSDQLRTRVA